MSKTKGQTFRYRFGNETKTFWYRSRICLVENRLFKFGPESAELRRYGFIPVRCRNVCGTFVPLLFCVLTLPHTRGLCFNPGKFYFIQKLQKNFEPRGFFLYKVKTIWSKHKQIICPLHHWVGSMVVCAFRYANETLSAPNPPPPPT